MKTTKTLALLTLVFFLSSLNLFAQYSSNGYRDFSIRADSLLKINNFQGSIQNYLSAFNTNGGKGLLIDRFNLACAYAQTNQLDSAFYHLERLASKGKYSELDKFYNDKSLFPLKNDKRWLPLIEIIKQNNAEKDKVEAKMNKPLIAKLDTIYQSDQNLRKKIGEVEKKYGRDSKEIKEIWAKINYQDSLNLKEVTKILDENGWLGADVIGSQGNTTLFLVVQHSDQKSQEKYLPMMREAVKNGKAKGDALALLEDRVAIRKGKMQIYGSQIGRNAESGKFYVLPIEDEPNVNKRRAAVGLEPLENYVKKYGIDYKVPKE